MWILVERLWVLFWRRPRFNKLVGLFTLIVAGGLALYFTIRPVNIEPPAASKLPDTSKVNIEQPSPHPPPSPVVKEAVKKVPVTAEPQEVQEISQPNDELADSLVMIGDSMLAANQATNDFVNKYRATGVPAGEYNALVARETDFGKVYADLLRRVKHSTKKDDETPPQEIPLGVTGEWIGEANARNYSYRVSATITQESNGAISGSFFWQDSWGGHAREYFEGYIQAGVIHCTGSRLEDVVDRGLHYIKGRYTATLSPTGDKLSGSWTEGDPGTFTLLKQ